MANKTGQKQTESNSQKAGKPGFVAESVQMLSLVSQENTSSQTPLMKEGGHPLTKTSDGCRSHRTASSLQVAWV